MIKGLKSLKIILSGKLCFIGMSNFSVRKHEVLIVSTVNYLVSKLFYSEIALIPH